MNPRHLAEGLQHISDRSESAADTNLADGRHRGLKEFWAETDLPERNPMDVPKPPHGETAGVAITLVDPQQLRGREVEIQLYGRIIDRGVVDCLTADGSVLWLKPDALNHRRLIQRSPGLCIRICASDAIVIV